MGLDGLIPTCESVVSIYSLITAELRSLISVRYGVSLRFEGTMITRCVSYLEYLFVVNLQYQAVVSSNCAFQHISCILIEYISTCRQISLCCYSCLRISCTCQSFGLARNC